MDAQKVLKGFFWFAFAAFLAASIPHVAYFFRAFEPQDSGLDIWYWAVATFIAISIDVTLFLLSMTVTSMIGQNRPKSLILSVWLFIVVLALLSWYMNNQYAEHFKDSQMLSATPLNIPMYGRIPDINPLIASCFQILAIAYTWMSDKIASNETPKTAAELEKEATELAQVAVAKTKIAAIKRQTRVDGLKNLISAGGEVVDHAKTQFQKPTSTDTDTPVVDGGTQEEMIDGHTSTRTTDPLQSINLQSTDTPRPFTKTDGEPQTQVEITAKYVDQSSLLEGLSGRSTMSIEDASRIMGYEIKYVRSLRNKGKLKATPRNNNLLTVASVKAYLETHQKNNSGMLGVGSIATESTTNGQTLDSSPASYELFNGETFGDVLDESTDTSLNLEEQRTDELLPVS